MAKSWTGLLESPPGPEAIIDGRRYLYFAGTAYFGLQGHPAVIEAGCEALRHYGVHTATSRGGYGANPPLLEVEQLAAEFFATETAYYFISGYWGNSLVIAALQSQYDVVLYDEQSHYSILEAIDLSGSRSASFAHRDAKSLRDKLLETTQSDERPLVLTDGVFAASGRIAPVDEYLSLLQEFPRSILALDDAHAVGVLGNEGRGTFESFGIPFSRVNRTADELPDKQATQLHCCGTLSKAVGGSGGIVAGSYAWIEKVRTSSRYFNAASTPAAPVAGATAAALRLVLNDRSIIGRLRQNTQRLRCGLRSLGLDVSDEPVPFVSIVLKDAMTMQYIQRQLRDRGIIIAYAQTYSGVGPGGHLRIAVCAAHSESMIERLVQELGVLMQETK